MSSVRRPSAVWLYSEKRVLSAKNVKAVCKACKIEIQAMPIRMEKHLENCEKHQTTKRPRFENGDPVEATEHQTSDYWKKHTVKTKGDEVKELALQLTRAIISSNSPFSLVEDSEVPHSNATWDAHSFTPHGWWGLFRHNIQSRNWKSKGSA